MRNIGKKILKIMLVAVLSIFMLAFFFITIELPFLDPLVEKINEKCKQRKIEKNII